MGGIFPASTTTIGWPEGRTPVCAEVPNPRVYTGSYPVAIQSLLLYLREERSNSAQSPIPLITPLRPLGSQEALTQAFLRL